MIVHVPVDTNARRPVVVTVHTVVVLDVKTGVRPESLVADSVGVVPNVCVPGLGKVIVWVARGVTPFDAAEGEP
ncbi:hypothetical protein, partial [Mesorhizobium sp. M7A.F.Ca.CA.002.06.1.1]|uniref:hypothetical protein n=1 Tax=Mesorhizobium sp. M7A.F.Ca.CA.002.06.1.1 TaxID=2496705 RepID=UPI0019D17D0B